MILDCSLPVAPTKVKWSRNKSPSSPTQVAGLKQNACCCCFKPLSFEDVVTQQWITREHHWDPSSVLQNLPTQHPHFSALQKIQLLMAKKNSISSTKLTSPLVLPCLSLRHHLRVCCSGRNLGIILEWGLLLILHTHSISKSCNNYLQNTPQMAISNCLSQHLL